MIVLVLISAFYMVQSKMYVGISGAYTYDEGQARCRGMGGQLATFDNWNDFNKIREVRRNIGGNGYGWIGMNDRGTEHHWTFIDGSTHFCEPVGPYKVDCDDIDMWSPGEPNDYGSGEDCAEIWQHTNGLLNDGKCNNRQGFICEFQSGSCQMAGTEPVAPYIPSGNPNSNYILEITGFKGLVTVVSVALNLIAFISICWIVMKKKKPSPYSKVKMYATEEEPL
eukprot:283877_1